MDFTFLKASGEVAFFRSDAEQAEWTEEEMSLFCTFPLNEKKIERGMTVLFKDPATGAFQAYEIRNCQTFQAEGYQQFTAEDIAISELTDCHIPDDIELTNITAQAALNKILPGTGWSVGNVDDSSKSTADIGRGSVWQGVITIRNNWNVNFLTRVTVGSGGITGRYIDIIPTEGTWRGLRLAIDKNTTDPCVNVDDSELYTALYAYGASYTEGTDIETQKTVETNIAGVTWSKTSAHPAKPAGQKFLEWPEKTALYGRKGKARFGYYQNTSIKDPNVLLQKTWETLKSCSEPKVSFTGTVTDMKRFGYNDVPLRLYDMAIIDFGDAVMYKQIVKLTVNLLDATGNRPTIGDYIPNIIYINRETENYATGGSTGVSGGRGGGGGSRSQKQQGEFETSILQNERNIILEARQVDENRAKLRAAGIEIDPITGVVIYAEDVKNGIGSNFKVISNEISSEVKARTKQGEQLSSTIKQTANSITQKVTDTENRLTAQININSDSIKLKVDKNGVISAINVSPESIDISAKRVNLSGYVTAEQLAVTDGEITKLKTGVTKATSLRASQATMDYLAVPDSLSVFGYAIRFQQIVASNGTFYALTR